MTVAQSKCLAWVKRMYCIISWNKRPIYFPCISVHVYHLIYLFITVLEQINCFVFLTRLRTNCNIIDRITWNPSFFSTYPIIQEGTPRPDGGHYVYRFLHSPMCDYMRRFIELLVKLPNRDTMNSVLENFTILHVGLIDSSRFIWTTDSSILLDANNNAKKIFQALSSLYHFRQKWAVS